MRSANKIPPHNVFLEQGLAEIARMLYLCSMFVLALIVITLASCSAAVPSNQSSQSNEETTIITNFPDIIKGPIEAEVISIIDGDSINVLAHIWPGQVQKITARIEGIDAPELKKAKCKEEKIAAIKARDRLNALISNKIQLSNIHKGKYADRVIATIHSSGSNIGEILLQEGLAIAYDGKKRNRQYWCPANVSAPSAPAP